jgi:hypothetical protein
VSLRDFLKNDRANDLLHFSSHFNININKKAHDEFFGALKLLNERKLRGWTL